MRLEELHYEELHDLCSAPYIVTVIISMRMKWTEHVAGMGKREIHVRFLWGNAKEIEH
jgi:hypothetical protein